MAPLFIIALILAACQPADTDVATPTAPGLPDAGELPLTGGAPEIEVSDQEIQAGTVRVNRVSNPGQGWIVIHADENGAPGPVIGFAPVIGAAENVRVDIEVGNATETLYAMLHEDVGMIGEFEFPGPDGPVQLNGELVVQPFRVTGGLEGAAAD